MISNAVPDTTTLTQHNCVRSCSERFATFFLKKSNAIARHVRTLPRPSSESSMHFWKPLINVTYTVQSSESARSEECQKCWNPIGRLHQNNPSNPWIALLWSPEPETFKFPFAPEIHPLKNHWNDLVSRPSRSGKMKWVRKPASKRNKWNFYDWHNSDLPLRNSWKSGCT